jgi:bifunctional enzyme CysN/CysC
MLAQATQGEWIDAYLDRYRRRELLRFLTCGSVDDGKSTLIGRLLHDSQTVYEDQLNAARRASVKHGTQGGEIDLALLVDGLQAEREQGITIDVAYRYFATPGRKFIIADTPGHEQYTRNMATGASTCDLAVILVDATRGVLDQTRRHAFIATLLGIRHLVVAVNKMDLVDYAQEVFARIREEFTQFAAKLQVGEVHFIPISALRGDNVVHESSAMRWYRGGPLLDYLENVHIASDRNLIDLRFPIQLVMRQDAGFRGYAGTISSGVLRAGDEVLVLPSGARSRIRSLLTVDGPADAAFSHMPVTITLEDEVDASRGDMIVHPNNVPHLGQELEAMVVWMHEEPVMPGRDYVIKHTTAVAPATVTEIRYRINVNTLRRETCDRLGLNEIGRIRVETPRPLALDPYVRNRITGAFILIDRLTNATVAAGMVLDRDAAEAVLPRSAATASGSGPTAEDWARRVGQQPVAIRITAANAAALATELRQSLFRSGFFAEVLDAGRGEEIRGLLNAVGVITIVALPGPGEQAVVDVAHPGAAAGATVTLDAPRAEAIHDFLAEGGWLRASR